ncbi:MAG: MEKHLA domain-containing protein [Cyanophyceae cyanobacterium]
MTVEPWRLPHVVEHTTLLLDSFERVVGRSLLANLAETPEVRAQQLFGAPLIVVSHGTEADPIFNYGNQRALELWETNWDAMTQMPSRLTAEPMNREERSHILSETARQGYVEGYCGVRISTTGQRFRILDVIIWNLLDGAGIKRGQAATYTRIELLK